MTVRAAELVARFRFDAPGGTTDQSTGAHTPSTTEVCTRPIAFSLAQDERFGALRAAYPGATYGGVTRRDSKTVDIATGQIATWIANGRTFEVLGAIDPDGTRRWIHVALKEQFPAYRGPES